jgi:hypothetical protein
MASAAHRCAAEHRLRITALKEERHVEKCSDRPMKTKVSFFGTLLAFCVSVYVLEFPALIL